MSEAIVKDIDKIQAEKPIRIFGKDVREITCFRKSFIYGISLGVVGGLATFLFTSKAPLSSQVAFGSLWLGVFGYWIPCRYQYESSLLKMEELKKFRQEKKKEAEQLKQSETVEGNS